jgi:MFS-type transporter involved in bile tolerance (Atg22 family)
MGKYLKGVHAVCPCLPATNINLTLTPLNQVYQAVYGFFICPWYSYSQIMISEVTPRGYEFLFFSLFSIIGKTSSFIGPLVSSAIVDATPSGNASMPFYFLFGLSLLSFGIMFFWLDLKKSGLEQRRFLEESQQEHQTA